MIEIIETDYKQTCSRCDSGVSMVTDVENVIDLNEYMRISNYLMYLQGIGILSENKRITCSNYIQEYFKEKKSNLEALNSFLKGFKQDNNQNYNE